MSWLMCLLLSDCQAVLTGRPLPCDTLRESNISQGSVVQAFIPALFLLISVGAMSPPAAAAGHSAPVDGVVPGQKGTKADAVSTPVELSLARAETLQNPQLIDAQQPAIKMPARAMA